MAPPQPPQRPSLLTRLQLRARHRNALDAMRGALRGAGLAFLIGMLAWPVLMLPGADVLAWFVLGTSDVFGPPGEPPWISVVLLIAGVFGVTSLVVASITRPDLFRLGDWRLRLGLGLYLIATYAYGLYLTAAPEPIVITDLSREGIRAAVVPTIRDFSVAVTFYLVTPFVAVAAVAFTGIWRYWLVWRPIDEDATRVTLLGTIAVLVFLTEAFALYTAFGEVEPLAAIEYYAWHLADAVPLAEIPTTLNWTPQLEFNSIPAGARLLVYKVLVILPLIALVREWIKRSRDNPR